MESEHNEMDTAYSDLLVHEMIWLAVLLGNPVGQYSHDDDGGYPNENVAENEEGRLPCACENRSHNM